MRKLIKRIKNLICEILDVIKLLFKESNKPEIGEIKKKPIIKKKKTIKRKK